MGRDDWAVFVQKHASRYLYAGKGRRNPAASTDDVEIREFLEKLGREEVDRRLLLRLSFVTEPAVMAFFRVDLPALLRALSHEMTRRRDVSRGVVKGKIIWSETALRRARTSGGTPEFVVRVPEKSSDLPETRLLRLFLTQVRSTVVAVEEVVGTAGVPEDVLELRRLAEGALREAKVREAGEERVASVRMKRRAFRKRDPSWGRLARLQKELDQSVLRPRWDAVLNLLRRGWLAPVSDDDLFELYALVFFLSVLEQESGFEGVEFYGLIRRGRREVAVLRNPSTDTKVTVFFDQGPGDLMKQGRGAYDSVLRHYDLDARSHRPDVTAVFEGKDGRRRILFLEVKRSEDGAYIRGSVYKMFGYFHDFSELWEGQALYGARGVLLLPEDVEPRDSKARFTEELVLVSAADRDALAQAVLMAMKTLS